MKRIFYYLPSIIFNAVEFLVIILIGVLLEIQFIDIMCIILLFGIIRMLTKSTIHYKNWKLCLLWSTLQMFSLFLTYKVGIIVSILMITFTAIILSGKGNINDIFMWNGTKLNQQVYEWVKFNSDNSKLIEYEKNLYNTDKRKYYIFVYRFKEFKSYSEIAKLMEMSERRVAEEIRIMCHFIEYSIRLG